MGKFEDYKVGKITLKIFKRLPYRIECTFIELIGEMTRGATPEDFSVKKKMTVNDFLLTKAVLQPEISMADLDNYNHDLNDKFREIGDYLFEKYIEQFNERMEVKKKLLKSQV